jgi:hypothetical protein
VVAFQVSPEQPAEAERQIPQGRVVEHRLAFAQVGDQDVADRAAGNPVAVDQLGRAELTGGAERPEGRGCVRGEHAHLVQQLVEPHRLIRAQRPAVDGQRQLQAVPDGDLAQGSALDRENGRRAAQRRGPHRPSGRGGSTQRRQLGETAGIPSPGHDCDQVLRGAWVQDPVQARADHVSTGEQQRADPQVARSRRPAAGVAWPRPGQQRTPPLGVAHRVGAADQPPLLPGVAWVLGQPIQQPGQPQPASCPRCRTVLDGERRGEQLGQQRLAGMRGHRPQRCRGSGREPLPQLCHVRADQQRGGSGRRVLGRDHADGERAHKVRPPNSTSSESRRYALGTASAPVPGTLPAAVPGCPQRR